MKTGKSTRIPNLNDRIDIQDLGQKIKSYKAGMIDEERFKHFRLTRGVYGQRQVGVHMFRTKLPLGRITARQLIRLAETSKAFATGNLHLTTRQNIQYHYVKLDDATKIWTALAEVGVNAREACGNTVRNITASAQAGIDPNEPFDVSPYAHEMYKYFLRNPVCQEMGRKIKIAFSSSEYDTAYTYFHDFGFIPILQNGQRGFKLVIGGGLGAQSIVAQEAFAFIAANKIIPFTEAAIRVFDRHGEREKRFKARMKYLLKKWGLEKFLSLVEKEMITLGNQKIDIQAENWKEAAIPFFVTSWNLPAQTDNSYQTWKKSNTWEVKQGSYLAVGVKIRLGDIKSEQAIQFANLVKKYAADDIRITVNQGFLLRFVHPKALPHLYNDLQKIGLADAGFSSIADITACPGTDTCNLGVTNSTALANQLETHLVNEHNELLTEHDIQIKISGCMNSCGQHMAAQIGFHGSSIKVQGRILPAMQVVLGGGIEPNGKTFIGEKVIKLPTKRIPQALSSILTEYKNDHKSAQTFNDYYWSRGKKFFYDLLKPLADVTSLSDADFLDWGENRDYVQAIGVGECAGASVDVVSTVLQDADERMRQAYAALKQKNWAASIYFSYSTFVISAKALLLAIDVRCNTHQGIIDDFQSNYVESNQFEGLGEFAAEASQINKHKPSKAFATKYYDSSKRFLAQAKAIRKDQLSKEGTEKRVVVNHYKA